MSGAPCSPGSHPHSDRPNWRPAETADEFFLNCQEGLETYSDRRMAKLLGMSRVHLWRIQLAAELPDALADKLLALRPVPSMKALAEVALVVSGHSRDPDVEACPHCGGVLRIRGKFSKEVADTIRSWLDEQSAKRAAA